MSEEPDETHFHIRQKLSKMWVSGQCLAVSIWNLAQLQCWVEESVSLIRRQELSTEGGDHKTTRKMCFTIHANAPYRRNYGLGKTTCTMELLKKFQAKNLSTYNYRTSFVYISYAKHFCSKISHFWVKMPKMGFSVTFSKNAVICKQMVLVATRQTLK